MNSCEYERTGSKVKELVLLKPVLGVVASVVHFITSNE